MRSRIHARFIRAGARTSVQALHESGALRLRLPRGPGCVATLVNTGGGLVAGDRVDTTIEAASGADLTVTSVAAEKVYRVPRGAGTTTIVTRLVVAEGASVAWLPQETILFDGARLDRSLTVDLSGAGAFVGAEMLVFGRLAAGEASISGLLRDRWHIRRNGMPIFADETALEGAIGAWLDRPAVAGGARAVGLLTRVGPDNAARLDDLRAGYESRAGHIEAGASLIGDVLVGRLLAPSPAQLRLAMLEALHRVGAASIDRIWM